jgi:hypothetical protein
VSGRWAHHPQDEIASEADELGAASGQPDFIASTIDTLRRRMFAFLVVSSMFSLYSLI